MFRRPRGVRIFLLTIGLLGGTSVLAETSKRWVDPPSDFELLTAAKPVSPVPGQSAVAAITGVPSQAASGAPVSDDPLRPISPETSQEVPETQTSALTVDDASTAVEAVLAAPPPAVTRKDSKPAKAARARSRKSRAARSDGQPFARLFGPPRRDSHVITTTHTR